MTRSTAQKNVQKAVYLAPMSPWDGRAAFYSWLTVSTFSPDPNDRWARGWEAPFQIVILPGYQTPSALEMDDAHSIWLEGEVSEPTVVWDGHAAIPLFETISECFDPAGEMRNFLKVRKVATGEYLADPRSEKVLLSRPVRAYAGDMLSLEREDEEQARSEVLGGFYYDARQGIRKAWSHFAELSKRHPKSNRYHDPKIIRERIAKAHPNVDEEDFFEAKNRPSPAPEGLRFGLYRYWEKRRNHPEWYMAALRIERNRSEGVYENEFTYLAQKAFQRIPLSDREKRLYDKEKKRISKMTTSEILREKGERYDARERLRKRPH